MTNIFGLDVHPSYQPFMDFVKLKEEPNWDMRFVIVKSSEGYGYKVKRYPEYIQRIKDAGLLTGNYHYFYATDADTKWEAERQAEYAVGIAGETDLPFCVDLEDSYNIEKGFVTPQRVTDGFLWFMDKVESLVDRTPMLYTARWFMDKIPFDMQFLKYPLWVASYQYPDNMNPEFYPVMPRQWSEYSIHQFSTKYVNTDVAVRGYEWPTGSGNWYKSPIKSINCDINRTTEEKLNELLGNLPPTPLPDPPTPPEIPSELVEQFKKEARGEVVEKVEGVLREFK